MNSTLEDYTKGTLYVLKTAYTNEMIISVVPYLTMSNHRVPKLFISICEKFYWLLKVSPLLENTVDFLAKLFVRSNQEKVVSLD